MGDSRWDGDLSNETSEVCARCAGAVEERVCAMQFHETILERIGKTLRGHDEGITHEPLPRRWVDLILYLDEQERKRAERRQPRAEPRQRRRE
jgi:hypothetical protein